MEEDLQRRVARNEATFRDVNEALKRGHWPGEDFKPVAFRCECAQLGCTRMIELRWPDYERIRSNPRHFLMAPDHNLPDAETVVERHEAYVVVEKHEAAGREAKATDPRP